MSGNACITASGAGIAVVSASDVIVTENVVVSTGDAREGVRVVADNLDVSGIAIRDNRITVDGQGSWKNGIAVRGNRHVDDIVIVGNSIADAGAGISFVDAKRRADPGLRPQPHRTTSHGAPASLSRPACHRRTSHPLNAAEGRDLATVEREMGSEER